MAELRIIVAGAAGRMGRMVVRAIHEAPSGLALAGALRARDLPWFGHDPGPLAGCPASGLTIAPIRSPLMLNADAIIDFSSPAATIELAGLAAQARIAEVIGTTGLAEEDLEQDRRGRPSCADRALRQHEPWRQPARRADAPRRGRAWR